MIRLKPETLSAARYTALMGLLFASAAVLNWIESVFSAALPAGMRVGLANIVIMAAILTVNLPSAAMLVILKSCFVFLTRGFTAGVMSLAGSLLAFGVTALLFRKTDASYILISVLGSMAHCAGQILASRVILGTDAVFAYAPVLAVSSAAAGICTGIVLKAVFPRISGVIGRSFESTVNKKEDMNQ